MLEANEHRRTLLQQRERARGVRAMGVVFASAARWLRERPARLVAVAAVVIIGTASLAAHSAMTGGEPPKSWSAVLADAGRDDPAEASVTLSVAGPVGDEESDAEAAGEPGSEAGTEPNGGPTDSAGRARAADTDVSGSSPSRDEAPEATADTSSEPASTTENESAPSGSTSEPELSDTGEPEPAESPEPEAPDDETDTSDGTCLGVNALGLTVNLCTSLLE